MRMRAAVIAGVVAMMLAAGSVHAWAAPRAETPSARAASIAVSPSSGPAGQHVTIGGSRFRFPCPIFITFTDAASAVTFLGSATASGGAFKVHKVIPSTAAVGRGKVAAFQNAIDPATHRCASPGPHAKQPFTVTARGARSLSG
jgi:hypothetical protein